MAWTSRKICYCLFFFGVLVLLVQVAFYFNIQEKLVLYGQVEGQVSEEKVVYRTGSVIHERMKYVERPDAEDDDNHAEGDYGKATYNSDEGTIEGGVYHMFRIDRVVTGIKDKMKYMEKNNLPILMWWTPFTGEKNTVKRCSKGECYFTDEKKLKDHPQMKVFFFYGTDFNGTNMPLPRKPHHEWALLHEESPKNSFLYSFEDTLKIFNHTSTFRAESDYPVPTQYLESLSRLESKPLFTLKEKEGFGLAPVVYLQSGCNPPSDRDAYVNELMKYIQIDSYGKCLKNKQIEPGLEDPLVMHEPKQADFLARYKFVLAFENGICKDYITEKLWNPLYGGAVPIYKGAPNILDWMPNNHSIILVDDFAHPKQLAEYIKFLANNESEYDKYLAFKKEGVTNRKLIEHMKSRPWGLRYLADMNFVTGFECMVCDRIHENRKRDLDGLAPTVHVAKLNHFGCPKPVMYPFEDPPGSQDYERTTWQNEYEEAEYTAEKIRKEVMGESTRSFWGW